MAPKFHTLNVADVRRETDDAVSIAFQVPDDLRDAYRFVPGQYLTLRATVDGRDIRRSYSICSGPADNDLRVAIRKVEGGLFSGFANESIAPGDTVQVRTPDGRVTFEADPARSGSYAAFAAGSGITPILSIVKAVLTGEPKSTMTLVYGNRTTQSVIFREELEDLKNRFPTRLTLVHVLSRETMEIPLLSGRIDAEKALKMLRAGKD